MYPSRNRWQRRSEPVVPTHELKTSPRFFEDVAEGKKTFDVRKDRGFAVMDHLLLREWDPEIKAYTGRELLMTIFYMAIGTGLRKGYVVLGLHKAGRKFPTKRLSVCRQYEEKKELATVESD